MSKDYPCASHTTVQLTVTDAREAYVRATGELDLATADRLADALAAAALCSSSIHLDLEEVRFMDATTVNVLAHQDQVCRRAGGSLRLHNATGEPRRVLRLCGLEKLLG